MAVQKGKRATKEADEEAEKEDEDEEDKRPDHIETDRAIGVGPFWDRVGTILAKSVLLVYDVREIGSEETVGKSAHYGAFTGFFASDSFSGQWTTTCYHSATSKPECPIIGHSDFFCDSAERDNHDLPVV
jgi:hypothetical protein